MSIRFKSNKFLQTLGPGILFASTAIGVSHLIQSTKAGANYGFTLILFILAANIFKFPFFEFGSRYASATGTSLLEGYKKMHWSILLIYLVITLSSMFFVCAAVTFVAAGFFENLLGITSSPKYFYLSSLVLLSICFLILRMGKYHTLDGIMKIVAVTLLLTTVLAFGLTLWNGPVNPQVQFIRYDLINSSSFPFIIALMGWMPTAVDLSTWNSLWTLERIKDSGYKPSLKETLREFNIAYWISAFLSICFLTLGAYLVFSSGESMPSGNVPFTGKVISLFTQTFGKWSFYLIAIASFAIMFGTTIGVLDGYSRTISKIIVLFKRGEQNSQKSYNVCLAITALGSILVIYFFNNNFSALINFATTLSFLIAPLIAILNFKLVTGKDLKKEDQPGLGLRILSYLGIILLTAFSIFYLYHQTILKP
ncbi:MAG: Mn2+/Fe2+ NRAMP family transporter [Chitinophagales bacterium]|jgi:Mn2+/Fe2+ NRAMP family transporter